MSDVDEELNRLAEQSEHDATGETRNWQRNVNEGHGKAPEKTIMALARNTTW